MSCCIKKALFVSCSYFFFFLSNAQAVNNLQQEYEQSLWSVKSNHFLCQLTQTLDGYARLSIETRPSTEQVLIFQWLLTERPFTDLQVYARRADWQRTTSTPPQINFFSSKVENQSVHFNSGLAPLIRSLKQGFWLNAIVGFDDQQTTLTFTNTFSDSAVTDYQQCLLDLAPLSWEKARDNEIGFASGQRIVKKQKDITLLKNIVEYISFDNKVTKVMVDGHTDNVGSPLANRLLSKERADDVAARLVEFGLPEKMIEVRAHGQRYPKSSNQNKAGQSSNRRVLIRLFRDSN